MRDSLPPIDYDGTTIGTYTYDTRQRRQTGQSVNYGSFSLATGTTYNALGQKSSTTYPDGAQYSYTYDSNNQLSTVNFPTGFGSITINSYLWTVPSQITLPGGTVRTQQYDGLLRLKTLAVTDPGQSSVMNYQYNYDLTDNITTKATEAGTTNYSYDTLDRLTGATPPAPQSAETFSYDAVANRLSDATIATYSYNANNQLTQVLNGAGTISYSYDANGNTLSQSDSANTRNYVYDTDNRLIEVRDGSNTLIAAYSYDPFGRRLSKDAGASKTYYLYNEEGLIAEADATGQVTRSYGYAPGSTYTTNPLWMKTGTAYYTYQNDHLGTPMKLLSQSGAVVWSATYDAFGKATVNPASTVTNNLRFPGQYADAETGLHYNWMRYYDPTTGRYVTSDPIGINGRRNFYTYVYANPMRYRDEMGLLTNCEMKWLNDNYGYVGGFIIDTFNLQQYIPGHSDSLKDSWETLVFEVTPLKGGLTYGVGWAGAALDRVASGRFVSWIFVTSGTWAATASGVLEVAGAFLTPFATTALVLARQNCFDPIAGKRCK